MANIDRRYLRKWEIWSVDIPITIADGQTVGSTIIYLNGTITRLVLTLPDLDTDTTAKLTIENQDNKEIYDSGNQDDNGDTPLAVEGDVCGKQTFKITCTTAQTGAKSCNVEVTLK